MSNQKDNSLETQFGKEFASKTSDAMTSTPALEQSYTSTLSSQESGLNTLDGVYSERRSPVSAQSSAQVSLAHELINKGYHPVMIFGTRATGKTSLLTSLFHYLNTDVTSGAMCMLGEWIVPTDTPYGQSVASAAQTFFNRVVMSFNDGDTAPRTMDTHPFYIPIVLRPKDGQPEVKLAFLESRGEWYQVDKESDNYFPELRDEVADVYRNYPDPISVLMIAPYVMTDAAYTDSESPDPRSPEIRDSDKGLVGALRAYQSNRVWRERDNFLFILTKWDAYTRDIVSPEFSNPPKGLIEKLIHERFELSWNLFQTMPKGPNALSMQYSSGLMSGDTRLAIPQELRPLINQFPRALLGWLYQNAAGVPLTPKAPPNKKGFVAFLKDLFT